MSDTITISKDDHRNLTILAGAGYALLRGIMPVSMILLLLTTKGISVENVQAVLTQAMDEHPDTFMSSGQAREMVQKLNVDLSAGRNL